MQHIKRFFRDTSSATTVDLVVLTWAIVAPGVSVAYSFIDSASGYGDDIRDTIIDQTVTNAGDQMFPPYPRKSPPRAGFFVRRTSNLELSGKK